MARIFLPSGSKFIMWQKAKPLITAAVLGRLGKAASASLVSMQLISSEHVQEKRSHFCLAMPAQKQTRRSHLYRCSPFPWLLPFHAPIHKWHGAILTCGFVWGSISMQEAGAKMQVRSNARSTITLSLKKGKRIRMHEFVCVSTLLLHLLHDWVIVAELKNVRFKLLRPHRPQINDHLPKACCITVQC